LFRMLFS